MADVIRVHTFPPGFGLPTTGPFTLKLAMALRMAGVPYEMVVADLRRGPKRKVPWIESGDLILGDTELILAWLAETRGVDLDAGLEPRARSRGRALRALVEERWHQVYEIELVLHPDGAGARLGAELQAHFRQHLFERGMLRHSPDEITRLGRGDLDAVAAWLDSQEWTVADRPTLTDCSVFGLLAPAIFAPLRTPCMSFARTLGPIVQFVERCRARFFPEIEPAAHR